MPPPSPYKHDALLRLNEKEGKYYCCIKAADGVACCKSFGRACINQGIIHLKEKVLNSYGKPTGHHGLTEEMCMKMKADFDAAKAKEKALPSRTDPTQPLYVEGFADGVPFPWEPKHLHLPYLAKTSFNKVNDPAWIRGAKDPIPLRKHVPVLLVDLACKLLFYGLGKLRGCIGVLVIDSGTVQNCRCLPIILHVPGFKPILLSVNDDQAFYNTQHTGDSINLLLALTVDVLKKTFGINTVAVFADGAANMQSVALPMPLIGEVAVREDVKWREHLENLPEFERAKLSSNLPFDFRGKFSGEVLNDPLPSKFRCFAHLVDSVASKFKELTNVGDLFQRVIGVAGAKETKMHLQIGTFTRWNREFITFEDFKNKIEQDQQLQFRIDPALVVEVTTVMGKLKLFKICTDVVQGNSSNTFDSIFVIGLMLEAARPHWNEPLRKALFIGDRQNKNGHHLHNIDRLQPMVNDLVVVAAALCPLIMFTTIGTSCVATASHGLAPEVSLLLKKFFGEEVQSQYIEHLASASFDVPRSLRAQGSSISYTGWRVFWNGYAEEIPERLALARAALQCLALVCSEAQCERFFSCLGLLIPANRGRLGGTNREAAALVATNFEMFEKSDSFRCLYQNDKNRCVAAATCRDILLFRKLQIHNRSVQDTDEEVAAHSIVLYPNEPHRNWDELSGRIKIGANDEDGARRARDDDKKKLKAKDRKKKMSDEELRSNCGACDKPFLEHQDIDENDTWVQCEEELNGCGLKIHISCAAVDPTLVGIIGDEHNHKDFFNNFKWTCVKCRSKEDATTARLRKREALRALMKQAK